MKNVKHMQVGINRFSAFHVHDGRHLSCGKDSAHFCNAPTNLQRTHTLKLKQNGDLRSDNWQGVAAINCLGQLQIVGVFGHFLEFVIQIRGGRYEDRKEPAAKPSSLGFR